MSTPLFVQLWLSASLQIRRFQVLLHQTDFGLLLEFGQVQGHQSWKLVNCSVHDLALTKYVLSLELNPSSWVEQHSSDLEKSCDGTMGAGLR